MEEQLNVGSRGCVGVAAALIDRLVDAPHSALNMIVPVAATANAAVDLEDQAVFQDGHSGELNLISDARGRAILLADPGPKVAVIGAVDVEIERLLGARQEVLDGCKLGIETAKEFDAFLLGQVSGMCPGTGEDGDGEESQTGAYWRRTGTFQM